MSTATPTNKDAVLLAEVVRLKDALLIARNRIEVLRGKGVLSSTSSRGAVLWLKAILEHHTSQYGAATSTSRHLKALIKTLGGKN
jgi:hypothetical protein